MALQQQQAANGRSARPPWLQDNKATQQPMGAGNVGFLWLAASQPIAGMSLDSLYIGIG